MSESPLICINCNKKITKEMMITPEYRCMYCGSRIFRKARPPIVRRVIAR